MAQPLAPVYALEGSSSAFCYTSSPGTAAQSVVTNAITDRSLEGLQNANPQVHQILFTLVYFVSFCDPLQNVDRTTTIDTPK